MTRQCDSYRCSGAAYTEIWQVQVDGRLGWTVLCSRHGSKLGTFTRDAVSRKLVVSSRRRRWWDDGGQGTIRNGG